jgi:predicted RNA-binding Zn-ribbon protein involved in translation (DUF1610 family)
MEILKRCSRICYQGRCMKCSALLELNEEEYANILFTCPNCKQQSILRKGTISRFFVDDLGRYERG